MATMVIQTRENMPGFNPLGLDDVHTPPSDYYHQGTFLGTHAHGVMFSSQTEPADLPGCWDAAVEGTQNFQDYADPQDAEDFSSSYGPITPPQEGAQSPDGYQPQKWAPSLNGSSSRTDGMRRTSSKASPRSRKHEHKLVGPTTKTEDVDDVPQLSSYGIIGNALPYQDGSAMNGPVPNMNQYLMHGADALQMASIHYGSVSDASADGLPYVDAGASLTQHIDPTQVHMNYEPSLAGLSPGSSHSSISRYSRSSLGDYDDNWSLGMMTSPTEAQGSFSPDFSNQSPRDDRKYSTQLSPESFMSAPVAEEKEDLPMSPTRQYIIDRESAAREHPLYKDVVPQADGLFHCPWENKTNCNHKPEKLKCNYDKFVDSHLKPYRCKHETCETARFSSTACLLRHEREAHAMHGHGNKPYHCPHEGCERAMAGNGFPRQWNLRDHMKRVHQDDAACLLAIAAKGKPGRKKKEPVDRKAVQKSRAAAEKMAKARAAAAATTRVLYRQWYSQRDALTTLVAGLQSPDTTPLESMQEIQSRAADMIRISSNFATQTTLAYGFAQQSG